MFVLNKETNRISKIKSKNFSELGYKEREHLQEWLESNTEVFGEDLLFIQKEFDGFDDTRERLDLLAIDKQGHLVIIENKLDDSGRDVTWQALKYASYCSSLSNQQIKDIYQKYLDKNNIQEKSEENIAEFLEIEDLSEKLLNQNQRIILVAREYRKEVTSTVLWLSNNYNLRIQCFRAVPYQLNEQIILNIEQVIPVKEIEEYTIKMAEKTKEGQITNDASQRRYKFRLEYWNYLLEKLTSKTILFNNINPSKDNWISTGSGVSGVRFNFVIAKSYARTEVYITRSISEENKFIFDKLFEQKENIENQTGQLIWERLDNKKACRIKLELKDVSLYKKENWEDMTEFQIASMLKIEPVFRKILTEVNTSLKANF